MTSLSYGNTISVRIQALRKKGARLNEYVPAIYHCINTCVPSIGGLWTGVRAHGRGVDRGSGDRGIGDGDMVWSRRRQRWSMTSGQGSTSDTLIYYGSILSSNDIRYIIYLVREVVLLYIVIHLVKRAMAGLVARAVQH